MRHVARMRDEAVSVTSWASYPQLKKLRYPLNWPRIKEQKIVQQAGLTLFLGKVLDHLSTPSQYILKVCQEYVRITR